MLICDINYYFSIFVCFKFFLHDDFEFDFERLVFFVIVIESQHFFARLYYLLDNY